MKYFTKKEMSKPQNILSLSRIPLSLFLIPSVFISKWLFIGLVAIISLTDFLDGIVARARNEQSEAGSWFDSFSDHIFYPLLLVSLYFLDPELFNFYWLTVLFLVAWWGINTAIMRIRFGKTAFIHLHSVRLSVASFVLLGVAIVLNLYAEAVLIITLILFAIRSFEETIVFLKMPKNKINTDLRFFWDL